MSVWQAFHREIAGTGDLFIALFALAILDLIAGAGRALVEKRFQSALLRQTASKLIAEVGLPLVLAVLAVVQPAFNVLVSGAIWLGIVGEATSAVEQWRGKKADTLATTVLKILSELAAEGGLSIARTGATSPPGEGQTPPGGASDG